MINDKYNNIKIPLNIDDRINNGVKEALLKKKQKKENRNKIAGIIAVSISLTIILGISNPAFAKELPIIGNVFKLIEETISSPIKYSKYAININETVSSNGVDITLSEAVSDGKYLYVTYVVEGKTPFKFTENEDERYSHAYQLFMKSDNRVSFTDVKIPSDGFLFLQGKFIDEYTFIGVQRYYLNLLPNEVVPDEFNFKTEIISIENHNPENYYNYNPNSNYIINGSWTFDIPIKVDKNLTSITELNDFEGSGIESISITKTPFNIIVDVDYDEVKIFSFNLSLYDENGEKLFFGGSSGGRNKREYIFELPKKESNEVRISVEKIRYESDENNDTKVVIDEIIYDKLINLK